MPLFSRFKNRGAQPASKDKNHESDANGSLATPSQPRWQSRWESTVIVPDEVMELVHVCTAEMKSRAEALDAPFLLLPFRPDSDPQGARTFIRNFFKSNAERSSQYRGESLKQEMRLTDSIVLCSVLKWCWSRMPSGVVSWPVYEGFRIGEKESHLARHAFDTFVPISAESEARRSVIFDFYDLLAAVAAHGKMNGLGGRKLSRLAGWWAFDHSDDGKGFEGGYKSWSTAADASSHLFFAYLRSLSPETDPSLNVIERIPRSLQALAASTEYPPETPSLLQRSTPRVVMLVDTVSPTPFALLRRAKNFEYRDKDQVLRQFQEFEDPIDALTDECKRVLFAVSSANVSTIARSRQGLAKSEESWSSFQNLGFADIDEKALSQKSPKSNGSTNTVGQGLRDQPRSRQNGNRPTTPSWADFLSSGFADDDSAKSPTLLYPPAQVLPPLVSRSSASGLMNGGDETLAPGELAAITNVELDDAFWWVWITSLAGEEPSDRKAVFGRCALVETSIMNGRWLIMEEQVKGSSPEPVEGAYMAPKKSLFSFTKRGRLSRKRSTNRQPTQDAPERLLSATPSKTSISTDQHAKIKAAARALTKKPETPELETTRRGRIDEAQSSKTNSMLTVGLQSEAGPAMQWAKSYDKNAIRKQYLGDTFAGKGMSREDLARSTTSVNMPESSSLAPAASIKSPAVSTFQAESSNRELPPVPREEPVVSAPKPDRSEAPVAITQAPPAGPIAEEVPAETSPPEAARPEPSTALDKEISVEAMSSLTSNRVERKPVPRTEEHPAFRPSPDAKPATPTLNPAAVAAAKAMQSNNAVSPESQKSNNKLKKQGGTSGGFKKFFGKKKDTDGRGDSLDIQRPSNGLAPPSEHGLGRRLSLMRKKPATVQPPKASETTLHEHPSPGLGVQEPVMSASNVHDHSPAELSRSSTHEHEAAEREFSRFDQGPVHDMPAAMPVDSEDDRSPIPNQHKFTTIAATRLQPQTEASPEATLPFDAPVSEDNQSEVTMEDHHDPANVQDRWATIRENAHKRAERRQQERASEEQSTQSRPSQSQRTDDDGETSGEETIESRVARIKARVAELTGNMDGATR